MRRYATAQSKGGDIDIIACLSTREIPMNDLVPSIGCERIARLRRHRGIAGAAVLMFGLAATGAHADVSSATKRHVAESEMMVQDAKRTVGQGEHGATELQRASDLLESAKKAVTAGQEKEADRRAYQAQLQAELAVAKMQSADARKSAAEVAASTEALRKEIERNDNAPSLR